MASSAAGEGVKISDISLVNFRLQKSIKDYKFQVKIKFKGVETETREVTTKKGLANDEDQVIWNESFYFPGDTNSVITFKVQRSQRFSTRLLGRLEKKAADLLQLRHDSEFCKFDVNDGNGQLSFKIELRSAIHSDIVLDLSKASTHSPAGHSTPFAHDTFINQENIWSPFLSQFQTFMSAVDGVAGIHPYVQLVWSILSVLPKTIITYNDRYDKVKELCEKLEEVYKFIINAERLPQLDETATNVLSLLVRQTIECAYFIQEHSKGHLAERIWKGLNIDNKIKGFIDKFDHLKKVIAEFVTLDTSIITLRVSKAVNDIRNLHLLDDMPYARDAGFIHRKRCLLGTRQKLIKDILEWVNNNDRNASERILVLSGQAGTGKSAVAHTIAEIFQKQNRLGSLFCFNRSYSDRINHFFSTITRDLADGDVLWRQNLAVCIDNTAIRRSTDMETQFNELIVKPSKGTSIIGPVIVIIDALDESGEWRERQPFLDILFDRLSELPENYRFILTTRPKQDIELRCQGPAILCKRMGHIPENETFLDIQSYVFSRLKPIAGILDRIQSGWSAILAKRAEGVFQWAETACRAMDSLYHPPSLKEAWDACTSGSSTSLYELYHSIISSQREWEYRTFMKDFKLIVGAIITAREPLTIYPLEEIFGDLVGDVKTTLRPFGSLLAGVHDSSTPVRPLHTSLLDFFHEQSLDGTNENEYYVNTSDQSLFTLGCLKLMNRTLRFNICGLETSHLRNRDVPNFTQRVGEAIPLHLLYACRFWGVHLQNSGQIKDRIFAQLRILMQDKLLYWLEALGLLGDIEKGRVAMRIMQIWCQDTDIELANQAADARQFGFVFGDAIETSTPHLYISALPFTPSDSFISRQFSPIYPRLFSIKGGPQFDSASKTGLVKKNSSHASSLAFSPQGQYIATGFRDCEFWFWDYQSGEILYQWKSQKKNPWNRVCDIVFSPDGQLVYYCFSIGHLRIWDIKTRETIEDEHKDILEGLEGECSDCTISSDGWYLIFLIRRDKLLGHPDLLLCDRRSRQKLMQLTVYSPPRIVFTPKRDMLAFYTLNSEVCLWNIHQQRPVRSWKSHHPPSYILALSDRYIAFGVDHSIEVWDICIDTLTMVCKFEALRFPVFDHSISFASDQHLIRRFKKTYTVWDISTGEITVESSLGDDIRVLAASPNSKYLALGTSDSTIHVGPLDAPIRWKTWDALDESILVELWVQGRYLVQLYRPRFSGGGYIVLVSDIATVNSIIFHVQLVIKLIWPVAVSFRNDHVYVACDTARRLCIWNDMEGEFILDKPTNITSFMYSPAGDRLISADLSGVKIWDVDTRTLIGGPYKIPGFGHVRALAFSSTGEKFLVAYMDRDRGITPPNHDGEEVTFIEVRERQSGHVLNGPFKSVNHRPEYPPYNALNFSANETKISWITPSNIEILDAVTGESKLFR